MAGLLGIKMPDAQKSLDLFTWFFFTKVEEAPDLPGAIVFRPKGPAFQRLVKLELILAPDETITAAGLYILRDFMEANSANAGDVAKSFVRYGDGPEIAKLSEEIMVRGLQRSRQTVLIRGELPNLSATPSPAYQVIAGKSKQATIGNLTLENQESTLVLSLGEKARPQGWFPDLRLKKVFVISSAYLVATLIGNVMIGPVVDESDQGIMVLFQIISAPFLIAFGLSRFFPAWHLALRGICLAVASWLLGVVVLLH
jgi:hypothetical protein